MVTTCVDAAVFCRITCVIRCTMGGFMKHFAKLIILVRFLLDIHMLTYNIVQVLIQDVLVFTTHAMVLWEMSTIRDNRDRLMSKIQ